MSAALPESWHRELEYVTEWLTNLMNEVETVDPWDEIEKYIPGENINLEDEKANERFDFLQVEHITKSLNWLKDEINKNYKLNAEQASIIQSKLDYLIDRVKALGKIDWKNIFVATIINIAFTLAMDDKQTKIFVREQSHSKTKYHGKAK